MDLVQLLAPKPLPVDPPAGSRRRRLWELATAAHCPVLGVCLPLPQLRRVVARALPASADNDDYRLHCLAVAESGRRGPLAEQLHKALEQRFALELRRTARCRDSAALATAWQAARQGDQMPGALWATLTHPSCDAALETQVLADVHMLQHQCGAAHRVDQARFEALQADNARLRAELEAQRQRARQQGDALQAQLAVLQARAMRERAQAIGRDTALAALQDELQTLQQLAPGLKSRQALARELQWQLERNGALERALARARQQAEAVRPTVAPPAPTEPARAEPVAAATLDERAVLCVGGRPASVPLYRHIVEARGGRFLHHDGGEEQGVQRLDATLSAADVVICQTGCISHDAYWRVKEHCKRHGKRCLFVDNPGSASLRRALAELAS